MEKEKEMEHIRVKFLCDDNQYNEWKAEELGTFTGAMTYQEACGPIMWIMKDNGHFVGANPTQIKGLYPCQTLLS